MKKFILCLFIQSFFTMPAQEWRWAKDNGTWSILGRSQIETHHSGDVYTAVTNTIWPSQVVFKKENTHGMPIWQKNIAGDNTYIVGLAVDKSNNSYLMGFFANNLVLPDTTYTNSGAYELFIAAYNSAGIRKWVNFIQNAGNVSNAIACDENENIIYAGTGASGSDTVHIKKFNHSGNTIWQKSIACNSPLSGIAIDKANNFNLFGNFSGTGLTIDGVNYYYSSGTAYYWKTFIGRFNSEGDLKKVSVIKGTQCKDLATDSLSANYYFTGSFSDSAMIGSNKIKTSCSSYNNNMCEESFAAHLDSNGTCHWAYVSTSTLKQIEALPNGKSYLSGTFSNTLTMAGAALIETQSRGSVFVIHLNKNGNAIWAVKDSGAYLTTNYIEDLALDGIGSAYLSGTFHNYYGNCWFGEHELPLTGIKTHYFSTKITGAENTVSQSAPAVSGDLLFPNPSEGKFYSPYKVERVTDCIGKSVPFSQDNGKNEITLVAASGIYFVELSNGAVLKLMIK